MPSELAFNVILVSSVEILKDIFGDSNVRELGENRFMVVDSCYARPFELDLNRGTIPEDLRVFDPGICFRNIAEFYLSSEGLIDSEAFNLGQVEVSVGPGSNLLYCSVGIAKENLNLGYDLREYPVIKLKNVTEANALDYLDKALFKIGTSQELVTIWPTVGIDQIPDYFSEFIKTFSEEIGDRDLKHTIPINSFNGAMRSQGKHEKFLQLYKVLEFFWQSALVEKMVGLRASNLNDSDFAKAIFKFNKYREFERLKGLLELLLDEDSVDILQNDVGLDFESANGLARVIYDFRNSIVHAKEEESEKTEFSERFSGEFSNNSLLRGMEYLALTSIKRWGLA